MGARAVRVLVSDLVPSDQVISTRRRVAQLAALAPAPDPPSRPISVTCIPRFPPKRTHPRHVTQGPRGR